jgi:hypothetical protein
VSPEATRPWDRATFLREARTNLPADQAAAVERLLEAAETLTSDMGDGRGKTGSVSPKFPRASAKSFFTVRTTGELQINRKWHDLPDAGEKAASYRDEFLRRLDAEGLQRNSAPA